MARAGLLGIDSLPILGFWYSLLRIVLAGLMSALVVAVILLRLDKHKKKWNGTQKFGKNLLQSASEGV